MTPSVRALIADDEPAAREELKYLLGQLEGVDVVAEVGDGVAALAAVDRWRPDLVFLDIRMPGPDGLEVARRVREMAPSTRVVFATAHDEHAIQAFAVSALDYLLKPFDPLRVAEAVDRARRGLRVRAGGRLKVERRRRTHIIQVDEVLYIRTDAGVVTARTGDGVDYSVACTLRELEVEWQDGPLFRCHREVLVNLGRVASIAPAASGTYTVVLDDPRSTELPVARNRVRGLKAALGL